MRDRAALAGPAVDDPEEVTASYHDAEDDDDNLDVDDQDPGMDDEG